MDKHPNDLFLFYLKINIIKGIYKDG